MALVLLLSVCGAFESFAQPTAMQNVMDRERKSLNGKWYAITDQMGVGASKKWYAETTYRTDSKLNELYFEGGMTLDVPGDWNSQNPEFVYYEGAIWYKRNFNFTPDESKRHFLPFAAVCRDCKVYLTGQHLGDHRGGFTPFQFEVGDILREGHNFIVIRIDNARTKDAIPAMSFDWWNYGGITRDVDLISTPKTFVKDYWLRLAKGSMNRMIIDVELDGETKAGSEVIVKIPEAKLTKKLKTDAEGKATIEFDAKLELWSPENPKLYNVSIATKSDSVEDQIGFRCFEVKGTEILLNGVPQFFRGINIHEEIAQDRRRSFSYDDAEFLTEEALALGCNFVRLSHYPQNEYMVKMCERKGLMMWEEIPVWQGIDFTNKKTCELATNMMAEMVERDKNRCGIVIWSVSNETWITAPNRYEYLTGLIKEVREWDDTRAISSALNRIKMNDNKDLELEDKLADHLDIIGINKYMDWYEMWLKSPKETKWITREDKPMIMSEFGAEAIYANYGDGKNINSWSEDYMKKAYEDNLSSFENIPNYRGSAPWILFDFRSPRRSHAMYQQGWNRKGLISPNGDRKQAWYVMRDYYKTKVK